MKHPLWILNSILLFLLIIAAGFVFFSWHELPERADIEPELAKQPTKRTIAQANINVIYENDLFGTYHVVLPTEQQKFEIVMPEAPTPAPIRIPEEQPVHFFEPLQITLKGIMTFAINDSKNRAIIEDNETKIEKLYKVGDKIEDAQLLRIFSNKIIFIRSNGQQEVLYLREKDALNDPAYASAHGWNDIIKQINENYFIINPTLFVTRIQNLGQFIDMLDLTTVYSKGESAGCRIGHLEKNSLGFALGLQVGDIILDINGITATTTANRFKIYKTLVSLNTHDIIKVTIKRNHRIMQIEYMLEEVDASEATQQAKNHKREQERLEILQKKETFAPTMQDIRLREKNYMREQGKQPIIPLSKPAE